MSGSIRFAEREVRTAPIAKVAVIASGFATDPTLPLLLQTTRSQKGQNPASDHMPPLGSIEIRSKAFHPKMDGMGLQ